MIEIKKNINLKGIDRLYESILKSQVDGKKVDLLLPLNLENRDFALLFSLIQFGATWIRSESMGKLIIPETDPEKFEEIVLKEHIYPFIVLAWSGTIVDLNDIKISKLLKEPSKEFFKRMDHFELLRKDSIPVFCFDHDLSKRGYSRIFYDYDRKIVGEDSLDFNLFSAYKKIGDFYSRKVFKDAIQPKLEDFNAIIHELFCNTHEHARTNEKGHNLYPNIRAIYLKFHKRTINGYKDIFGNHPGILEYFNSEFSLNDNNELYLFEISVLDSGPGFVKRYSKKSNLDIDLLEEVSIVKECLFEHNTSSVGPERDVKGLGLARVMKTLDKKGFFRIKTGRVEVFRDMKNHNYSEYKTPREIVLNDWKTDSPAEFTEHPEVAGTLISIVYPLDYKSK